MFRILTLFLLSLCTWVVDVFHMASMPQPQESLTVRANTAEQSSFVSHTTGGINQLILKGNDYERGVAEGRLTGHLLPQAESILYQEFTKLFGNPLWRWGFIVSAMRWFAGAERYIPSGQVLQNYAIAQALSPQLDYMLDGPSRQIAYHGIHEVGQFFVDVERDDFGCTQFAVKTEAGWLVARNFDFELQRFFDEEKIMKWHFPDEGLAYLSVIWVGMVGTVTGVNEKGVYIAINAAGSTDFRRYGTPTSMVVTEALKRANSAHEAVEILSAATVFVTDIFVVTDSENTFRVEKSPRRTRVIKLNRNSVIANHLESPEWTDDPLNQYRRRDLTSRYREQRGEQLLVPLNDPSTLQDRKSVEKTLLGFLRDRNNLDGDPMHLGNRKAIDALIATHAVIYNSADARLYVNKGPALVGTFQGYDLKRSFAEKTPVLIDELPADKQISVADFYRIKESLTFIANADQAVRTGACESAKQFLEKARERFTDHSNYYTVAGKYAQACEGNAPAARQFWSKALSMQPAYAKQKKYLEDRVL